MQSEINTAIAINENAIATQAEVNMAFDNLETAIVNFESAIVTEPDPISYHNFGISTYGITVHGREHGYNKNPKYIKTGNTSLEFNLASTGRLRLRHTQHEDWIRDWSQVTII